MINFRCVIRKENSERRHCLRHQRARQDYVQHGPGATLRQNGGHVQPGMNNELLTNY